MRDHIGAMSQPVTICIPLSSCGGKLKNDTELRFCLRALDRHFQDPFEVAIVGSHTPTWLTDVTPAPCGGGLKTAIKTAAEKYPDGFFWFYDDTCLIKDMGCEEMKVTSACTGWGNIQTKWGRDLEKIRQRLIAEGFDAVDYSRPHGPYWFDKSMVDEAFADWPGMKGKFPFETWILSKRGWPKRHGAVKQYYGDFKSTPNEETYFLNYSDRGNTLELQQYLANRFQKPSRFEIPEEVSEEEGDNGQADCASETDGFNKTIHFVWLGDRGMPSECAGIMQEWKDLHPDFAFKFWGETEVAQCSYASTNVKDTSLLPIFRADLFRLEIMANEGGVYTDLDVRPYKNCWGVFQLVGDFCYSDERPMEATNAIFMAKGRSKTAQLIRDKLGDISLRTHVHVLNLTGPRALRGALKDICDYTAGEVIPNIGTRYGGVLRLDHGVYFASSLRGTRRAFISGRRKKGYQFGVHLYAGSWHAAKHQKWRTLDLQEKTMEPINMTATFDMGKYPLTGETDWAMDDRHIYKLHDAAISPWQGSRVAVEIGSHKGRSTTALIEALNSGRLDHLHIVEPNVGQQLLTVLDAIVDKTKLTVHRSPACDTNILRADFVFIDGRHDWWAVSDALRALVWGAKVICLHDITAYPRHRGCWGAHHAAQALKIAKNRVWTQDSEDRPGEHTWVGFGISREIQTVSKGVPIESP